MDINKEIDNLLKLTNTNENSYEEFLKLRKEILSDMDDNERKVIEHKIILEIIAIFKKRKGDYFYWEDLIKSNLINKYFKIIVLTGDRNIGKTTSLKRVIKKVVDDGSKFLFLRTIQEEIKELIKSESEFLSKMNWEYDTLSAPNITHDKKVVGYYRDINTSGKFKSIEFGKVDIAVYDEFNTTVNSSDKFSKFTTLITTAQRYNENFTCLLQANFISQNDEILNKLGVPITKLDKRNFVLFNWITGAINIFIPSGIYKSTGNKKKNLGYRLSLADFDVFKSQYGGEFSDNEIDNVIDPINLTGIIPLYNIVYNSTISGKPLKMTMYYAFDKEGKKINYLTTTKGTNDKNIFVFDYVNKFRYINSYLLDPSMLELIINNWRNNNIKTDSIETKHTIIKLLAQADKFIENNDFNLEEIKEL